MKLTDEQRDLYRTAFLGGYLQKWEFDQILSSEQAWKESVENWQNIASETSKQRFTAEQRLNQAIEVLKGIERNSLDGESRYRAHLFLSSLQEDKP